VKFVFATTEIRKVPVTVLSRCQRFDLRRIDAELLTRHFSAILEKEGVTAEPEAILMIARAADGSARDGLSLLDQAIAQGAPADGRAPHIEAAAVRAMLGLADRGLVFELFEALTAGDGKALLDRLRRAQMAGADPHALLNDLLDLVHFLTRAKVVPSVLEDPALPEAERSRGGALADALSMAVLTRAWQTLMKGVGELQAAPRPDQALEMVLIRLLYMADLPTPADLIRRLGSAPAAAPAPIAAAPPAREERPRPTSDGRGTVALARAEPAAVPAPVPATGPARARPERFEALVAIAYERDIVLHGQLFSAVRPVRFEWGRFEFQPTVEAPPDLAQRLDRALREWTGERWMVSVVSAPGAPTLAEAALAERQRAFQEARHHPVVRAVLEAFPGAEIRDVRNPLQEAADAVAAAEAPAEEVPVEEGGAEDQDEG
jgi:DNA polymerase-3 subunit gamma/tau